MYMKEGIEWQHVDYFNNKVICDLVEEQHKGILAILDEACLNVGKVTDEVLQFISLSFYIRFIVCLFFYKMCFFRKV